MSNQVLLEQPDGRGIPPRASEDHLAAFQVNEEADVVLTAPAGRLVNADLLYGREVRFGPGRRNVVVKHPPQPRVVFPHDAGQRLDWHLRGQRHYQRLQQQRETTARTCPRYVDHLDTAAFTLYPWYTGVQVSLILEEV